MSQRTLEFIIFLFLAAIFIYLGLAILASLGGA